MKPAELFEGIPKPAVAIVGLGLAIFVREYSVMTVTGPMIEASVMSVCFLVAAFAIALLALVYKGRPSVRLSSRGMLVAALALATSISLVLSFVWAADDDMGLTVASCVHQIGSLLLIVAWCEVLLQFGSMRTGAMFTGAVFVYALCNILTALVKADFVLVFFALAPLCSGCLLIAYGKLGASGGGIVSECEGDSLLVVKNELVLTHRGSANSKGNRLFSGVAVMATIFLFRFSFGAVNSAWISLQLTANASLFGQISNLIGTVASGLYLLLLLAVCWNRSTLVALEFATLVSALFCVVMLQGSSEVFVCGGMAPLALGQKLVLLIVLLSPFLLDARNPRATLCAAFSFYMAGLGVCGILVLCPEADYGLLSITAVAFLVLAAFYLLFLTDGRSSESAQDVADRLGQSVFNQAEVSQQAKVPKELQERCLKVSRQYGLTQRENDVLFLLADRYDAASIAKMLYISEATAKTHMRKIYAKVGVHSQKELIKRLGEA